MRNVKVGLLPLYLELYDRSLPKLLPRLEPFRAKAAAALRAAGVDVAEAGVCRARPQFERAVADLEAAGAEAIVTLHLAYSPSEESAGALAATPLPVIALNATPSHSFDASSRPEAILENHGIHGVQDMANLLLRKGKRVKAASGHLEHSAVVLKAASLCRAAALATRMRRSRVGLLFRRFPGMGDFAVPFDVLRDKIGMEVVACDPARHAARIAAVTEEEITREITENALRFKQADGIASEVHRHAARANLAVRAWAEEERLTAFSVNFLDVTRASGLLTVPFLEAGKAMARGLGYAGEGDVLTAALVGALCSTYGEASFGEMFCPDWKHGTVFLSHMGEMNPDLAADKPILAEMDFAFGDCGNPLVAYARFKPGPAMLVNLAPLAGDRFRLLVAPGEMMDVAGEDALQRSIRGWFRPRMPLEDFLTGYAEAGGTHHLAALYGDRTEELAAFAEWMDWDFRRM